MKLSKIIRRSPRVFRKKISWSRIGWWVNLWLVALFGRRVRCRNSDEVVKVLPVVWKGKIRLLGIQHKRVVPGFSDLYTLELEPVTRMSHGKSDRSAKPREVAIPELVHVIMIHLPKAQTENYVKYCRSLAPDYRFIVAYGGKRDEFESLDLPDKFYVETPTVRGPGHHISRLEITRKAWELAKDGEARVSGRYFVVADYDLVPLGNNYFDKVACYASEYGGDFSAFELFEVTNSNNGHYNRALMNDCFTRDIVSEDGRAFHQEGAFGMYSEQAIEKWCAYSDAREDVYHEIHDPTLAHRVGLRLLDLTPACRGSAVVRFRPTFSRQEMIQFKADGYLFVHPFKDLEFLTELESQ